jgi:hypothetical protein
MTELTISEESAKAQIDLLIDYYDIDMNDFEGLEETEKAEVVMVGILKKLERAIRRGRLEITDTDGEPIIRQLLRSKYGSGKTEIVYKPVTGQAKVAMGRKKENDQTGRIYALLGSLSGDGESTFLGLKGADLVLAENLGLVFLLV